MKIKISEKSLTLKMTEDELKRLLDNHYLENEVRIGPGIFFTSIDAREPQGPEAAVQSPVRLASDGEKVSLLIQAKPQEIQELADMGKNRDGISIMCDNISLIMQVDLRSDTRPRKN